ncbi:MAG: aa3-type cytochrome c oxidase subunit IV [Devosia sp.]|jgi:hypothetical protein|uniref:aa3-type cytochrome c oxidase subunit IV n=1 Tax=unclassified Devosia TaxID=196773 RepID=UPI000AD2F08E|nr:MULTISPECIES: aa3-type cytochrome c oxidase subunit IV [unclassified Devosia]MBL8598825.1 aa3-type cytochrome c oxidase subunit IV [Devosia sp.]MBN9345643.1 aa3-type cytochrome c oxidase subunit IV [Devosia sp.]
MADNTHDTETISDAMDYAQHDATWGVFTNLIKWGIIACAVLAVALYIFIQP